MITRRDFLKQMLALGAACSVPVDLIKQVERLSKFPGLGSIQKPLCYLTLNGIILPIHKEFSASISHWAQWGSISSYYQKIKHGIESNSYYRPEIDLFFIVYKELPDFMLNRNYEFSIHSADIPYAINGKGMIGWSKTDPFIVSSDEYQEFHYVLRGILHQYEGTSDCEI